MNFTTHLPANFNKAFRSSTRKSRIATLRDQGAYDLTSLRSSGPIETVVVPVALHIVRFSGFHQIFETYPSERAAEETRVHVATAQSVEPTNISGLAPIAQAYRESQKLLGFAVDKVSQVH